MQLGLKEGNSVNEIKIHRHWSPKFCVWLGRGKKEAIGSCNVIQALLKTRKGEVFQCSDAGLFTMNFSELRACPFILSE